MTIETPDKLFTVQLTEKEMQTIATCLSALFNKMAMEKKSPSEDMALHCMNALQKMRTACEKQSIVVLGD